MHAVAERALGEWNLGVAKIELISRSENVVFRVDVEDDRPYALRVHRPGYHTLAELESEQMWTAALNQAGIGAPLARKTRAGDHYAAVGIPGTREVRYVGLVPWFDGVRLDDRIEGAPDEATRDSYFEKLGRLMAAMHDQALGWRLPARFQRHSLDADGFMGEAPFWGRFWEIPQLTSEQREILADARARIHARLSAYDKNRGNYSMIHADLRTANVLTMGDQLQVIDFDDAGFGWHQYDMAVVLFDYSIGPDFEAVRDALIRGYRSRRAISEEDLELLPLFLLIRTLASLGWLNDRPEVGLYRLLPSLIEVSCSQARLFLQTE